MIWLWIGGAVLLAAAAVLPPMLMRASAQRREYRRCKEAAQSAMSRLETALDLAGSDAAINDGANDDHDASSATGDDASSGAGSTADRLDALAEAQRCATLAGAALAGPDTVGGFRQAEAWARKGLAALGDDL